MNNQERMQETELVTLKWTVHQIGKTVDWDIEKNKVSGS